MKFKLICEYKEGDLITHEFNKVLLNEVLQRMQDFLKGCGYVFDGTLDIVEEETFVESVESSVNDKPILDPIESKIHDAFDFPDEDRRSYR